MVRPLPSPFCVACCQWWLFSWLFAWHSFVVLLFCAQNRFFCLITTRFFCFCFVEWRTDASFSHGFESFSVFFLCVFFCFWFLWWPLECSDEELMRISGHCNIWKQKKKQMKQHKNQWLLLGCEAKIWSHRSSMLLVEHLISGFLFFVFYFFFFLQMCGTFFGNVVLKKIIESIPNSGITTGLGELWKWTT